LSLKFCGYQPEVLSTETYFVKKVKGYSPDDTYTMANYFVPKTVTYLPTCERAMTYFMINLANVNEILTNGVLNENYKDNGNVL